MHAGSEDTRLFITPGYQFKTVTRLITNFHLPKSTLLMLVSAFAGYDEIKRAYRKLAHEYHPDISKDPEGEAKFKEIGEAYATLKDPEKRQEYDRLGSRPSGTRSPRAGRTRPASRSC